MVHSPSGDDQASRPSSRMAYNLTTTIYFCVWSFVIAWVRRPDNPYTADQGQVWLQVQNKGGSDTLLPMTALVVFLLPVMLLASPGAFRVEALTQRAIRWRKAGVFGAAATSFMIFAAFCSQMDTKLAPNPGDQIRKSDWEYRYKYYSSIWQEQSRQKIGWSVAPTLATGVAFVCAIYLPRRPR